MAWQTSGLCVDSHKTFTFCEILCQASGQPATSAGLTP